MAREDDVVAATRGKISVRTKLAVQLSHAVGLNDGCAFQGRHAQRRGGWNFRPVSALRTVVPLATDFWCCAQRL